MNNDRIDEDEVLRRMLNTPHEKHKPLGRKEAGQKQGRPTGKRD